jgi:RNA exonuclease 4
MKTNANFFQEIMTGVFLTRKQKKLTRERRRKKKLFEEGLLDTSSKNDSSKQFVKPITSYKKRSRPDDIDDAHCKKIKLNCSKDVDSDSPMADVADLSNSSTRTIKTNDSTSTMIMVPPHLLSSEEIRKFRKETRRQARLKGNNPSWLKFVLSTDNDTHAETAVKSKRQKIFPRINDLVAAAAVGKKDELEQKKIALHIAEVSDEVKSQYIAIDCEMVGVGPKGCRDAVARISIVDWDCHVLLDTFVRVNEKVTDFRTWISGIKPSDLKENTKAMPLNQCRDLVKELIKDKILLGHSIKHDLDALMLSHPKSYVRDTSTYRPYQRQIGSKWVPRKLRDLAQEYCNITIQVKGEPHDSTDDAKATMELYKLVHQEWEKELLLKKKTN